MCAVQWTKRQLDSIETCGRSLIVSAAAGSGKTAVLVERIINKLLGKNGKPCDIRSLMVVTFTNAAAAEMRAKISQALSSMLAGSQFDKALRRQLALVPSAHIETVHAFCLSLIRENFNLLGINPNFRVADSSEFDIIKEQALNNVLERFYAQNQHENPDFFAVCEALSNGKDDRRLFNSVLSLHEKLKSQPFPLEFIRRTRLEYAKLVGIPVSSTQWGKHLLSRVEPILSCSVGILESALDEIKQYPDVFSAYSPALRDDISAAHKLCALSSDGQWDEARHFCEQYKFARLGSVRNFDDKEFLEHIKSLREIWKKSFSDIFLNIFDCTDEQARSDIEKSYHITLGLLSLVEAFDLEYSAIKLKKNIADFNDLEHMAISLLVTNDGGKIKKTSLAEQLSLQYDEIMVDEYQDTNAAQDVIFQALSRDGKNLFMVGDIKQSIYRFRLADPCIFLEKYLSYDDIDCAEGDNPAKISMNKNFRSRRQVLDTVNFIFKSIMSRDFGDLDYTEDEQLNLGAAYPDAENPRYNTELYILDNGGGRREASPDGEDYEASQEQKPQFEARFIAHRIKQMIDEKFLITDRQSNSLRPVEPSDIAILLRSVSGKADIYKKALEDIGISCISDNSGEFFLTSEILTITSFLRVIDGISNDIPLVGLMRSPVYNFSPDELAEIRKAYPDIPFYRAVINLSVSDPSCKCAGFLRDIESYRQYSVDFPLSRLIWHIYMQTDMIALFSAMDIGAKREANLISFYEYSRSFDSAESGGLSKFIRILDKMREGGAAPKIIPSDGGGNNVNIMSIHKSKGLEFPVVIVPDCSKQFNFDDTRNAVLFHDSLGIGVKIRDKSGHFEHTTVIRNAISDKITSEAMSEELRVLYVALTRAKEKLIISMSLANAERSFQKWGLALSDRSINTEFLKNQKSPAMWIAAPFAYHANGASIRRLMGNDGQICPSADFPVNISVITKSEFDSICRKDMTYHETYHEAVSDFPNAESLSDNIDLGLPSCDCDEEIFKKLAFSYPYKNQCSLPSKITPTMIKGRFSDSEVSENAQPFTKTPALCSAEFELCGVSPAERGIAHHLAMQFIDFSRCTNRQGIQAEINRLCSSRILSEQQACVIDISLLEQFFRSPLADRMRASDNILREFKFSVLCPSDRFFRDALSEDQMLLQGVIDCAFQENGQFVIIDFKSDKIKKGSAAFSAEKYRPQLEAYSYALEKITGKKTAHRIIYFLSTGETAEL